MNRVMHEMRHLIKVSPTLFRDVNTMSGRYKLTRQSTVSPRYCDTFGDDKSVTVPGLTIFDALF